MREMTDRQTRKYIRRGRRRPLKNFLWWLFGFLTPTILLAAALAVGVFVIPVSTYYGGNPNYFVPEIANGTIFDFIQNYSKYAVSDMPIVEQLLRQYIDQGEVGKYIEINYDAINAIKLDGSSFENFNINDYVTVTATIRSLGFTDQMGDFGKLSAFTSWEEVTEEIDPTSSNFNPKLYYYAIGESQASAQARIKRKAITDPNGRAYARAFDDNGALVEGASSPYYYPALFDLPLLEMTQCIGGRIGTSSASSLFSIFGISSDSMIGKIVEGRTITGLGSISTSDIKLNTVVNFNDNETLTKILTAVTGVEDADEITLADLEKEWNTSGIKLSTVLDLSENDKLKDILVDVTGVENADDITLGDLEHELNTDNIRLETFLPESENTDLYKIIRSAQGMADDEPITVGSLNGMETDNIRLDIFLPEEENTDLYKIIRSAQGIDDETPITVGDLNGMETDNIKMIAVIPNDEDSKDLYTILSSCCRDEDGNPIPADEITVGDVHTLDSDNALLKDLLKNTDPDDDMAKILVSACSRTDEGTGDKYHVDYDELTVGDLASFDAKSIKVKDVVGFDDGTLNLLAEGSSYDGDIDDMTIGDMDSFSIKAVKLTSAIDETTNNEKLFAILEDALEDDRENLTVGDLDSFNIDNCKLTTVLSDANNETLYKVLEDATGMDKNEITIADLDSGVSFDNVKLASVMDYAGNEKMFDILVECTSATSVDEVTIGALSSFNTDDLHLTTIMPYDGNEKMFDILVECTPAEDADDITISLLSDFDTDDLRLTTVMPYEHNEKMYDILMDCTGKDNPNEVTIDALEDFDTSNLHLSKVLDPDDNAVIYNILREGLGASSNEDIMMSDFDDFDITEVALSSILTDKNGDPIVTGNSILDLLRHDDSVTVGNLGEKFDEVKLFDAYGGDVFTTDSGDSVKGDKYKKVQQLDGSYHYVKDDDGAYYVSKKSNIWLLFCYDVVSNDESNGCATEYAPSTLTFKDLTDGNASDRFTDSTIYNLIAAGIISESGTPYDPKVTKLTINQVIDKINQYSSIIL